MAIALGNELMIWQPASNLFVNCQKMHYQKITVLRFTKDGSTLISAGEDGMIVIWNLSKVLSSCEQNVQNAASVLSDHQLPVTDINVTHEMVTTFLLSTSMDRSLRIYELNSRKIILKIILETIQSVGIFGHTKNCCFLGDVHGKITKINLALHHFNSDEGLKDRLKELPCFPIIHKKEITSLVTTINSKILISGGMDKQVVIWNTDGQALKILPQASEITNIFISSPSKINYSNENSVDNPMQNLNRSTCDVKNSNMEIYAHTSRIKNKPYAKCKSIAISKNSIHKREEDNKILRTYNSSIFEHCKMLINLIDI